MDVSQITAFLRPMLDDRAECTDGNGTYGEPVCPELKAFLKARLGDLCPFNAYDAIGRTPNTKNGMAADSYFHNDVMKRRIALAMFFREVADDLLRSHGELVNRDHIACSLASLGGSGR